jgi:hypothetical protein
MRTPDYSRAGHALAFAPKSGESQGTFPAWPGSQPPPCARRGTRSRRSVRDLAMALDRLAVAQRSTRQPPGSWHEARIGVHRIPTQKPGQCMYALSPAGNCLHPRTAWGARERLGDRRCPCMGGVAQGARYSCATRPVARRPEQPGARPTKGIPSSRCPSPAPPKHPTHRARSPFFILAIGSPAPIAPGASTLPPPTLLAFARHSGDDATHEDGSGAGGGTSRGQARAHS